jgi:two-component system, sensor histidine kinase YesM
VSRMTKKNYYQHFITPALVVVVVLVLAIMGSATLLLNLNDLDVGRLESQTISNKYIADNIKEQIDGSIRLFSNLETNENIQAILSIQHLSQNSVDAFYYSIDFDTLLSSPIDAYTYNNLVLYTTNPTALIEGKLRFISSEVEADAWYQRAIQSRRNYTILAKNNDLFFIYKFSLDPNPHEYFNIGIVKLDLSFLQHLSPSSVKLMISNVALDTIIDIYGEKPLEKDFSSYFGIVKSTYIEGEMVLVYELITGTAISKWNLYIIKGKVNYIYEFIFYSIILSVIFGVAASFIFYRYSLIRKIDRSFAELSLESLEIIISQDSSNQVERIIKAMYNKIESLVQRNRELDFINQQKEAQKNEAEIKALLTQINPHYIFNLLNSIHKRALKNNEIESAKMILLMSKQLRRSLDWKEPFVTIQDELDHIHAYIELQQYYLGMICNIVYMVDNKLFQFRVPKLIFQSLIENALKHGVKSAPIYIKLYESDGKVCFSLKNEVIEKPREIEAKINHVISSNDSTDSNEGVGLRNMTRRLRFYYSDKYRIVVESDKRSISITLVLPKTL